MLARAAQRMTPMTRRLITHPPQRALLVAAAAGTRALGSGTSRFRWHWVTAAATMATATALYLQGDTVHALEASGKCDALFILLVRLTDTVFRSGQPDMPGHRA